MDKQHKVHGDEDAIKAVPISFIAPQADVLKNMNKQHEVDGDGNAIMAVPISFISPQADVLGNMDMNHNVHGDEDAIMAIPISFIAPQADDLGDVEKHNKMEGKGKAIMDVQNIDAPQSIQNENKVIEMIPKNMHYLHTHTFEQRRQNWIIENRSRPNGLRTDIFYRHLETNTIFRSLMEVFKFLVFGEIPERQTKKGSEKSQVSTKRKPLLHGTKLIKHYIIGTYDLINEVYVINRREINYLSECESPSNFEKKRKKTNEDLYGHQQVNLEKDASVKYRFYLWDFELISEAPNAKHT